MKRSLPGIVLSSALAFTLVGCGGDEADVPDVAGPVEASPVETDPTDIDPDAPETTQTPTDEATSTTGTGSEPTETGDAAAPPEGPIELVETSFDISLADMAGDEEPLSVSVPSPGTYTFRVVNEADIVHALEVEGHGIGAETGDIQPGATAMLEVELPEAGEYELYCPIGNHKAQGMDGSVVVSGG